MMSKIKLLTIAVIGLFLLNAGIITFMLLRNPPGPGVGRPPLHKEAPREAIIQMLHFDKEQSDQYKELIDQHQASNQVTSTIKSRKQKMNFTRHFQRKILL